MLGGIGGRSSGSRHRAPLRETAYESHDSHQGRGRDVERDADERRAVEHNATDHRRAELSLSHPEESHRENLVETAASAGNFKTLGRAIRAAGLTSTLSGEGPFTIFAPTDEAFAKLPKAELDALLEDTARLTQVLTYHVVPEIVVAPKAGAPRLATTVHGAGLKITAKNRGFRVNDAMVVKTEITASNGVIHAIDTVLMPR
jgi:uncharacterized surface protein with fasciclin (FAS1) repeats